MKKPFQTRSLRALFVVVVASMSVNCAQDSVAPAEPSVLQLTAGDAQTAVADAAVAVLPSVIVKDGSGNVMGGVSVQFAVIVGGGTITNAGATSDSKGVATVGSWTLGKVAGINRLSVSVPGTDVPSVTVTATGTAGAPAKVAVVAGNSQTATAGSAVANAPSISVADANDNLISGTTVTFAITAGGGTITGGTATTDSLGVAKLGSWTLGKTVGTNSLSATVQGLSDSPLSFAATGIPGGASKLSLNAGNAQTAVAGAAVAIAPSVTVQDANDNAVPNTSVVFTVETGGGTIVGGSATTNAAGVATITSWTLGKAAGANALKAVVSGISAPLSITATGVSGAATQLTVAAGDAQTAVAGSAVAIAPGALVRDANDNPVPDVAVTFTLFSGGGSIVGGSATTNASGVATLTSWTLGKTAGANSIKAIVTGIATQLTMTATGSPGSATKLTVNAGDAQSAVAGAAVAIVPSVLVRDANDNPVPNVSVAFAVTSGVGSIVGGTATTNASGVASITSWTLGTTVGANALSATVTGIAAPLAMTATGTPGAASKLTINAGNSQSAVAGSAVTNAPSALVRDANNNAVPGVVVTFVVASGGGAVAGGSATTDASGVATITSWTLGTTAGANTISASVVGITTPLTYSASGTAGEATQLIINAGNPQTQVAGSAVSVKPSVIVKDANHNPVAGTSVTFSVQSGGGSVSIASGQTNASGIFTIGSWTLGTSVGSNTLRASSTDLTAVTFTATGVSGDAHTIILSLGGGETAAVGTAVATTPRVFVKDANGNAVANTNIIFSVQGGGTIAFANVYTDANGFATPGSWTLGATVGTNTLTASASGLVGSPVEVLADATPGAAHSIVMSNTIGDATVNQIVGQPSVVVRDQYNNPVPGAAVTFAVTGGGGSITSTSVVTDASGVATAGNWTLGTTMGTNTVTATASVSTGSPVTFTSTGTPGVVTSLAVYAGDAQSAVVNNQVTTQPTVVATDTYGNPVNDQHVQFTIVSGGGSIQSFPSYCFTDANGRCGRAWKLGTATGAKTLKAVSNGITANFSATATHDVPSGFNLSDDGFSGTVNTALSTLPKASVWDRWGNPVPGVEVTFAVTDGGGSGTGLTKTTDANGDARPTSWTLGTTAGYSNQMSAQTATMGPYSVVAQGIAGPAAALVHYQSINNWSIEVANSMPYAKVQSKDAYGNIKGGVKVTFAVTGGGGSIQFDTATTDIDGVAGPTSWTMGNIVGANTLSATFTGLSTPLTLTANTYPGAITQLLIAAGNNQTSIPCAALTTSPKIKVADQYGNGVGGRNVTFSVTAGGGFASGSGSSFSDENGLVSGAWQVGCVAGSTQTLQASTWGGISSVNFSATVTPGPATSISVDAGNEQTATVHTAVATALRAKVVDDYGNGIAGKLVTFTVVTGNGTLARDTATSNASGLATAGAWTLGDTVGTHQVKASFVGGSDNYFTATATAGAAASLTATIPLFQLGRPVFGATHTPAVLVKDAYGNPVPNASVTFAVTGGGGNMLGGSQTTDSEGKAMSWGWSLGSTPGLNTAKATVAGVSGQLDFKVDMLTTLAGGSNYACGLTTTNKAYCFGNFYAGGLISDAISFSSISAGTNHTCALTSAGAAYCFGYGWDGRLGNNSTDDQATPVAVSGGLTFAKVSAGERHSCGVTTTGAAYCWGHNEHGRLGNGSSDASSVPVAVGGGLTFASISAGGTHTCGITTTGAGYCWGNGSAGRLGNGSWDNQSGPVAVSGGYTWAMIVASREHSCGVTTGGDGFCWGSNYEGRLGIGNTSTTLSTTPVAIAGGHVWASITAGPDGDSNCGMSTLAVAYCWGRGTNNMIGNGSADDASSPALVSGGHNFWSLRIGNYMAAALVGNAIYLWGDGAWGLVSTDASELSSPRLYTP